MKRTPELRFEEFKNDWKETTLKNVADIIGGGTPSTTEEKYWNGDIPWFTPTEIKGQKYVSQSQRNITEEGLQKSSAKILPKGSILLTTRASLGDMAISTREVTTNQGFQSIIVKKGTNNEFIYYLQPKVKKYCYIKAAGSTFLEVSKKSIEKFTFNIPDLGEQEKIASFLSLIDKKIELQTEKVEELKRYKKGIMQKIFSQELRFKDENGDEYPNWKETKLSDLLYEHKIRNSEEKFTKNDVLSVSGDFGIVNQIELLGRSYAGESIKNYHVVNKGDIVYTKSPLKSNPYGIIKVNKGDAGIVSTLYAVYSCKDTVNGEYLDYYFQLDDNTNRYLRPLVHKGAKNDMKINNNQVLSDKILICSVKEQEKIVNFIKVIDNKIESENNKLSMLNEYKKGLLQQMFI